MKDRSLQHDIELTYEYRCILTVVCLNSGKHKTMVTEILNYRYITSDAIQDLGRYVNITYLTNADN